MGVGCWVQNVCLPENKAVRVRSPINLATGMVGTSEVPPCGRLFFLLRLISSLSLVFAVTGFAFDVSLENLPGLEDYDPALLNGYLDASLGVEPDALDLAAHNEIAEAGKFHMLAPD